MYLFKFLKEFKDLISNFISGYSEGARQEGTDSQVPLEEGSCTISTLY